MDLEQTKKEAHEAECAKDGDDVCEFCGGTGEVKTMEQVYPGEPHMADVGSEPCPKCNPPREDDESDQDL